MKTARGALPALPLLGLLLAAACDEKAPFVPEGPEVVRIKDTEFLGRKFFWIADPESLAPGTASILPVQSAELFLDDRNSTNDLADGAMLTFAFVEPATGTPDDTSGVYGGFFHRLTIREDYELDPVTGWIVLEDRLPGDQALAVYYTGDDGLEVGSLANPDTLFLKIVAPPHRRLYDDAKGFRSTRRLEQKNVYSLGARNIIADTFEMRVLRRAAVAGAPGSAVQIDPGGVYADLEFVRILGLDYKGVTDPVPDLAVEPEYLDFEDGWVTFPNIMPFAPDSSGANVIVSHTQVSTGRSESARLPGEREGIPLLEHNAAIYEMDPDDLMAQDKYVLEVSYEAVASAARARRR